ncbi:MAG: hypothetical protein NVS1B4_21730 [Gemmatimonadaceae bacterium]
MSGATPTEEPRLADPREEIVDTLRGRILRGIHAGTLAVGDRLPSGRELAPEFQVDYRLILAAYRELAGEGLVELRARGGIYVAPRTGGDRGLPPLPESWFVGMLVQGLSREIPGPELHEWLRRCTETLRLRALVIASNADQVDALCRELTDDFGFEVDGLVPEEARGTDRSHDTPLALRRADLVVTTETHAEWVGALAGVHGKPVTIVESRPDLSGGEWALLLRRPVYAVVATEEFGETLRTFFANIPGVKNLRILVFGRDDLTTIPEGAPTYITPLVRGQLTGVRLRGRILPAARTISSHSARELYAFIVRSNVEAMSARGRGGGRA